MINNYLYCLMNFRISQILMKMIYLIGFVSYFVIIMFFKNVKIEFFEENKYL